MKRQLIVIAAVALLLGSCASSAYRPLKRLREPHQVMGTVNVIYEAQGEKQDQIAYTKLLEVARREYGANVDVYDVVVTKIRTVKRAIPVVSAFWGVKEDLNEFSATGQAVRLNNTAVATDDETTALEGAVARAAEQLLRNTSSQSKIAIVYITADDRGIVEYVTGELEFIWVNQGYTLIDRSQLDIIRREQNLQLSGEVDDSSAVGIGRLTGANIIVTGTVDGEGNLRRLRLRALDTQTAEIIGSVSERL